VPNPIARSTTQDEYLDLDNCHEIFGAFLPAPVHLVTLLDRDGAPNVLPVNFLVQVSMEPVMVAMALRPRRYSTAELSATGEFVVNVVTAREERLARTWGASTGRDTSKFDVERVETVESVVVRPPGLAAAVALLEFRVVDQLEPGSHVVFIGELQAARVKREAWDLESRRGFTYPGHEPLYYLQEDPDVYGSSARVL
jgi:flavin reductase (DIM6/NTAB) family NADH-FMN oxidoreductase RutF